MVAGASSCLGLGLAHPVGLAGGDDRGGVVQQPVQEADGGGGVLAVAPAAEANGVLDACGELGVTLIAYQPLAGDALTGIYTPTNRPRGLRRFAAAASRYQQRSWARSSMTLTRYDSSFSTRAGPRQPA